MITPPTPSSASIRFITALHSLEVVWWRPREGMVIFRSGNLRFEDLLVPFDGLGRKLEPFTLFRPLVVVGWGEDVDELGENFGVCLALIQSSLPSR
jgi:hypothetical protein